MKKALIALAAVAVIFTACGSSTDTAPGQAPTGANVGIGAPSTEVSDFVSTYEALHPGTVDEFCTYADQLGESTARDAFVQGFTSEYPDYAYANQVFDELMSRC
jgi:ABC-type phosphate/phosphonate transport system substrate-binding protein